MIRAGIDIGAGRIRVVRPEKGTVYNEPCLAALDSSGSIIAMGAQAECLRENGKIRIKTPFQASSVDFDLLMQMMIELCYELNLFKLFHKTSLLISYPTSLDEESVQSLKEHLMELGADEVFVEPQILMAALGTGLNLYVPVGTCVMNIGMSSCDIAVFRNGQIISRSTGKNLNIHYAALLLQQWIESQLHVHVSLQSCHEILSSIGCVSMQDIPLAVQVSGTSLIDQKAVQISINENQVCQALCALAREWGGWLNEFIESLDENDKADLIERGIIACGGGMCLKGVPDLLQTMAGCPLIVTDDPLSTTCTGVQRLLESMEKVDRTPDNESIKGIAAKFFH
jgi:rod shape-determining protein MreB